jgi:hypothetical protein
MARSIELFPERIEKWVNRLLWLAMFISMISAMGYIQYLTMGYIQYLFIVFYLGAIFALSLMGITKPPIVNHLREIPESIVLCTYTNIQL